MKKNIEKIKCMSCQKQDTVEINVILKEQIVECPSCGKFMKITHTKTRRTVRNLEDNLRTGVTKEDV